jgi:hypothetical protein
MLVLLSACGEDEERLIVEPAVSPTGPEITPPASTPVSQASPTPTPPGATATDTPTPSPTASAATRTATPSPTPTSTPPPLDVLDFLGVYDASFEPEGVLPGDIIAEVYADGDEIGVALLFDGHTSVGMQGAPRPDGHVALEGEGRLEDDIVFFAHGTASFVQTEATQRVRGSLHRMDMQFGIEGTFVLERPVNRVPSRYDGPYRFTFDPSPGGCACTTTATFTLSTDANGIGTMLAAADELDVSNVRRGTFDPFYCDVTTSGRLRCVFGYETTTVPTPGELPAGPRFPVTLTGVLTADGQGFSGQGRTEAPIFPTAYFLGGDWTATRVAP